MKMKNIVCLILALAMALSLAACGSSGASTANTATPAPAESEAPTMVYVSDFKKLMDDSENYISIRSYSDDGIYYSSWEKVGENIPEGVKPQYEGQYDVYETYLYYMDKDGKVTKLENYKPLEAPANDEGYKEFSSGSDLVGDGQVQGAALIDALHELVEGVDIQVFPHVAAVENEGAEILGGPFFGRLDRGGFLLESILYHIKS